MNKRELATTLHALRLYQVNIVGGLLQEWSPCDHFDGIMPLTSAGIDRLCERLNTEGV